MNALAESIGGLSRVKLAAMAGVSVLMLLFFIFLATRVSTPPMATLYTNVALEDSGEMVAELEKMAIPYELRAGGGQLMVPSDRVEEIRVKMAGLGLPGSGSIVGYEVFDSTEALGTSNFVLNVNKLRALEGELGRTISSLRQVNSARVHLVMPKRELFSRERREPTASVALKIRGGELDKQEISAVRHLVATSVPGLQPSRITIIDQNGNLLARGVDDENDTEAMAANAQEYRVTFENRLENTIESLLERSVGMGRVKAEVNANIDFDRIVTNSETFDPEGQVARSVQTIEETEQENEKDVRNDVTVANNLPDADPENAGFTNNRNLQRTDETTNFEISKTVKNHIKQTGTVNRVSVAVLVDGTYTDNEEGESTYQPRSEQELEQFATLIRSAIGYDADRGDVVEVLNMRFAAADIIPEETFVDQLTENMPSILQTLAFVVVAVLVILMVLKPLVQSSIARHERNDEEEDELQHLLASPELAGQLSDLSSEFDDDEGMISIDKIDGGVKSSLYLKISQMIDSHPEECLGVIRGWAFETDDS